MTYAKPATWHSRPLSCSAEGPPSPLTAHRWLWQMGTSQKLLPMMSPFRWLPPELRAGSPLSGTDPGETSSRDCFKVLIVLEGALAFTCGGLNG